MGIFNILKTKIKKDVKDAETNLIAYLAKVDFSVVEQNQMEEYEKALNEVSQQMAKAKVVMDKETKEYIEIKNRIQNLLKDANTISEKINVGLPVDKKQKFEDHLDKLLTEIETLKQNEVTEKEEADDATEHFNLLREAVEESARKLTTAKKMLADKKRELEKTSIQQSRLKEQEEQKKILYGIKESSNALGNVVGALDSEINKKKQDIEATKARLDALSKHSQDVSSGVTDPEIAEALGRVQPKKTLSERLSSLQ